MARVVRADAGRRHGAVVRRPYVGRRAPCVTSRRNIFRPGLLFERRVRERRRVRSRTGRLAARRDLGHGRRNLFTFNMTRIVRADAHRDDAAVVRRPFIGRFAPCVTGRRDHYRLRIGFFLIARAVVRADRCGVDRAACPIAGCGSRFNRHRCLRRCRMAVVARADIVRGRRGIAFRVAAGPGEADELVVVTECRKRHRLVLGVRLSVPGRRCGIDDRAFRFAGLRGRYGRYRGIDGLRMRFIVAAHQQDHCRIAVGRFRPFTRIESPLVTRCRNRFGLGLGLERRILERRGIGLRALRFAFRPDRDRGGRLDRLGLLMRRIVRADARRGHGAVVRRPYVGRLAPCVTDRRDLFRLGLRRERRVRERRGVRLHAGRLAARRGRYRRRHIGCFGLFMIADGADTLCGDRAVVGCPLVGRRAVDVLCKVDLDHDVEVGHREGLVLFVPVKGDRFEIVLTRAGSLIELDTVVVITVVRRNRDVDDCRDVGRCRIERCGAVSIGDDGDAVQLRDVEEAAVMEGPPAAVARRTEVDVHAAGVRIVDDVVAVIGRIPAENVRSLCADNLDLVADRKGRVQYILACRCAVRRELIRLFHVPARHRSDQIVADLNGLGLRLEQFVRKRRRVDRIVAFLRADRRDRLGQGVGLVTLADDGRGALPVGAFLRPFVGRGVPIVVARSKRDHYDLIEFDVRVAFQSNDLDLEILAAGRRGEGRRRDGRTGRKRRIALHGIRDRDDALLLVAMDGDVQIARRALRRFAQRQFIGKVRDRKHTVLGRDVLGERDHAVARYAGNAEQDMRAARVRIRLGFRFRLDFRFDLGFNFRLDLGFDFRFDLGFNFRFDLRLDFRFDRFGLGFNLRFCRRRSHVLQNVLLRLQREARHDVGRHQLFTAHQRLEVQFAHELLAHDLVAGFNGSRRKGTVHIQTGHRPYAFAEVACAVELPARRGVRVRKDDQLRLVIHLTGPIEVRAVIVEGVVLKSGRDLRIVHERRRAEGDAGGLAVRLVGLPDLTGLIQEVVARTRRALVSAADRDRVRVADVRFGEI